MGQLPCGLPRRWVTVKWCEWCCSAELSETLRAMWVALPPAVCLQLNASLGGCKSAWMEAWCHQSQVCQVAKSRHSFSLLHCVWDSFLERPPGIREWKCPYSWETKMVYGVTGSFYPEVFTHQRNNPPGTLKPAAHAVEVPSQRWWAEVTLLSAAWGFPPAFSSPPASPARRMQTSNCWHSSFFKGWYHCFTEGCH